MLGISLEQACCWVVQHDEVTQARQTSDVTILTHHRPGQVQHRLPGQILEQCHMSDTATPAAQLVAARFGRQSLSKPQGAGSVELQTQATPSSSEHRLCMHPGNRRKSTTSLAQHNPIKQSCSHQLTPQATAACHAHKLSLGRCSTPAHCAFVRVHCATSLEPTNSLQSGCSWVCVCH